MMLYFYISITRRVIEIWAMGMAESITSLYHWLWVIKWVGSIFIRLAGILKIQLTILNLLLGHRRIQGVRQWEDPLAEFVQRGKQGKNCLFFCQKISFAPLPPQTDHSQHGKYREIANWSGQNYCLFAQIPNFFLPLPKQTIGSTTVMGFYK